jgi:transcriptional regulator with XRE-family HTH domain
MTTATLAYPKILLTGPAQKSSVPHWMRRFSPRVVATENVRSLSRLPELTVVRAEAPAAILALQPFLRSLANGIRQTPRPAKILFVFDGADSGVDPAKLFEVLTYFDRPADIEFIRLPGDVHFRLDETVAKIWAEQDAERGPVADPLREIRSVIAATADLRTASGRLSAQQVAKAFGLSLAELAGLLGRSRQAVSKTGDAESLQPDLAPFERIARLGAALSRSNFLRWLRMPNEQLKGLSPLDAIRDGHLAEIADLAEDMLTGNPT